MLEGAAFEDAVLVRVVIPTLREPVGLASLIQEHGDHRSMVTLAGTSQPAGIAAGYHAFVDYSTGVVNRLFPKPGPTFYRIEVEGAIEAGNSFQLPVLVAHALREDGNRLAALGAIGERPEAEVKPATQLVWASGTIAPVTYAIGRVDDVKMKLEASRALFETALAAGVAVRIFIPAANADEITPELSHWLGSLGLVVEQVQWMDDVLKLLALPPIPRAATPLAGPQWKGNPYRGLDVFNAEHQSIFFGRAQARAEAAQLLRASALAGRPFLLVHGPSGVGKSSLVLAGLVPDLIHNEKGWQSISFKPVDGLDGLHEILGLMWRSSADKPTTPEAHVAACEALIPKIEAHAKAENKRTLLVIDQLEELFNPRTSPEEARAYGQILERLVQTGVVWVVATIRSDLLPAIDRVPELRRLASSERSYRVAAPSPYDLLEIISAPAALAGRPFDHRFAEELAAEATKSPDSLPLLEALLYRLYELNTNPQDIAGSLEKLGGFEGAIRNWADSIHAEILSAGVPEASLDRALVALVRIEATTGALLSQSRPYRPETESGAIHARLVEARLATTSNDAGVPQVRLVHDTLTTHWPLLARLGERLGAAIALRDELEADASRWRRSKDDGARLLRGEAQLAVAEALVADGLVELGADVAPFVAASRTASIADAATAARLAGAEVTGRRLRRTLFGVVAAAVLLLIVVVPVAALLWIDARVADIREALTSGDIEIAQSEWAALLASPVAPIVPFTESGVAVSGTLLDTPKVTTVLRFDQPVMAEADEMKDAAELRVGNVAFFYYGDLDSARVVRCQDDGSDCTVLELPEHWRASYDKLSPVLRIHDGVPTLMDDYWSDEPGVVQGLSLTVSGPLQPSSIELSSELPQQLMPWREVLDALPYNGGIIACDEQVTTCLGAKILDAHETEKRFDLWRKGTDGWQMAVEGLSVPLPSVKAGAISDHGEWIALTVDTRVMIWRANQIDAYRREPHLVFDLAELPLGLQFDQSGKGLLVVTGSAVQRIILQQRLGLDVPAQTGPTLRSGDDFFGDRYILVESHDAAYALDTEAGGLSTPIPLRHLTQVIDDTTTDFETQVTVDEQAQVAITQFEPDGQTRLYSWPSTEPIGVAFSMGLNPIHIWKGGGRVASLEGCDIAVYETASGKRSAVSLGHIIPDCDMFPSVIEERADGLALDIAGEAYSLSLTPDGLRLEPRPVEEVAAADNKNPGPDFSTLVPAGTLVGVDEISAGRYFVSFEDRGDCAGDNYGSVMLVEVKGAIAQPAAVLSCAAFPETYVGDWSSNTEGDVTYLGAYFISGLVRWTSSGVTVLNFTSTGIDGSPLEHELPPRNDGTGKVPDFDVALLVDVESPRGATAILPSPDGKTIGFWKSRSGTGQTDVKLTLLDLETHTVRTLNNRYGTFFDEMVDAAFSPDGALVLTYKSEASGWELFRVSDGWRVPFPAGVVVASFIDADTVKLVFDTGAIGTWKVPDAKAGTGRLIQLGAGHV